jgi:hypothetical protein
LFKALSQLEQDVLERLQDFLVIYISNIGVTNVDFTFFNVESQVQEAFIRETLSKLLKLLPRKQILTGNQ